jgi:hypothetical protein
MGLGQEVILYGKLPGKYRHLEDYGVIVSSH